MKMMTEQEAQLWQKISKFELDDPSSILTFSSRLARENNWSLEFTLMVIQEYKKFIFLLCVANHPLTPSDEVDQVWHLHLLYTQSYWISFCNETLQRQIHHGPTKGGISENDKYTNWYEKTKEVYFSYFQQQAPAEFWPSSAIRFKEIHFVRVNLHRNWVIKKLFFKLRT
jgi:hypothetical protein